MRQLRVVVFLSLRLRFRHIPRTNADLAESAGISELFWGIDMAKTPLIINLAFLLFATAANATVYYVRDG